MFLLTALAISNVADASTIIGNPSAVIETNGGTPVTVWTLELERCSGGIESLPLRQDVSPNDPLEVTLPVGSFCEVSVILHGPPNPEIFFSPAGDTLSIQNGTSDEATLVIDPASGQLLLE